ncbi:tetratricopeptide repeat protein [Pontibacter sp. G13]|uniref:tetratricopeptide repeat protein n=1 Tax=Pontibacter sp. G13 TaxID=3074898 RepID=UPI00288A9A69|nr:tetratricopeptide repeat protein [Pontibacter sp. G13]WNJ19104.1 tetratricopeptide repeat protein [Pontibacter sp. G13]
MRKSVQSTILYVLLGLFGVLLLNSLLLFLLDFGIIPGAYRGTLMFHLFLGVGVVVPIAGFLMVHLAKMPHRENLRATLLGAITALGLVLTLATGGMLYLESLAHLKQLLLAVHVSAVFVALGGAFLHWKAKRRGKFHFFVPYSRKNFSKSPHWHRTFKWTATAGMLLFTVVTMGLWTRTESGVKMAEGELAPAAIHLTGGEYLHESALDDAASCGTEGCHPDIYSQWEESVHHFSSFNNPYYLQSIENMLATEDPAKVKWCASCHDPLLLTSGKFEAEAHEFLQDPLGQKGITCLTCHAMDGAADITGNGNYQVQDKGFAAMAQTFWGSQPELRNTLIRTKPEPHAASMMDPYLASDEYCTSCHKVSVPQAVNEYRWKRGQNQYDAWYASSFSRHNPRTFYQRERQSCVSCHMEEVPSMDQGNDDGMVASHRFAAANSAIPHLNEDTDQLHAVQQFLMKDIARVEVFSIEVNGRWYGPEEVWPNFQVGDHVRLEVLVSNTQVGHNLPAGTNDSNEWWLEVSAGSQGKPVLISGDLGEDRMVDSTAHKFHAVLIDREGGEINRRNVHDWHATIYNSSVPSGLTHIIHYEWTIPQGQAIDEITVHLKQRKFNRDIHAWTLARTAPNRPVPDQPITTVATGIRKVGEGSTSQTPLWKQWNNYGIGLLREERSQGAWEAFQRVAELAPDRPDGLLNQGRAMLSEGSLDKAILQFQEVLKTWPDHLPTQYFLGEAKFELGDYPGAIDIWEAVAEHYPKDPLLLGNLGELHYLMGDYAEANRWYESALAINPENPSILYGMMLVAGALNDLPRAEELQARYLFHKPNSRELEPIAAYRKTHPHENREAQAEHTHGLREVKAHTVSSNANRHSD